MAAAAPQADDSKTSRLLGAVAIRYRSAAVLLVNVLLLLVVVNVGIHLAWPPSLPGAWDVLVTPSPRKGETFDEGVRRLLAAGAFASKERFHPRLSPEQVTALMLESYGRPFLYEPFTEFKERPHRGRYINVDEHGYRWGRQRAPWPPDPRVFNVFVFGGSTTFGHGLADAETIPARLQDLLAFRSRRPVRVYNFGRSYYFSTQERILFEQLVNAGHVPDAAVFVDGLNDHYFPQGEPALTPRLRAYVADREGEAARPARDLFARLPMVRLAEWVRLRLDSGRQPPSGPPKGPTEAAVADWRRRHAGLVPGIVARYIANQRIVDAIASDRGIAVTAVWQPVPVYRYDLRHHAFAGEGFGLNELSRDGYPAMRQVEATGRLGRNFVWCADIQEGLRRELYLDLVHYTPLMARRVAHCIARAMLSRGLLGASDRSGDRRAP